MGKEDGKLRHMTADENRSFYQARNEARMDYEREVQASLARYRDRVSARLHSEAHQSTSDFNRDASGDISQNRSPGFYGDASGDISQDKAPGFSRDASGDISLNRLNSDNGIVLRNPGKVPPGFAGGK